MDSEGTISKCPSHGSVFFRDDFHFFFANITVVFISEYKNSFVHTNSPETESKSTAYYDALKTILAKYNQNTSDTTCRNFLCFNSII